MELKKCIVLDLDNTLWGGVVGEDGMENLALSLDAPGNSFIAFQQALLDHYNRGVLLAINSRNNPEDALKVIREHPNMILKENHFAALRMNWLDKAENMRSLAQELNIGLDSMVFLDDDPVNRAMVRSLVPEAEVPELPESSADYARFLNSLPYFPAEAMTDEDGMRGNLYVTERLRRHEEEQHPTKEVFLGSLGLSLSIYKDDAGALARLSQMTGKTNQFNIEKRPYTEEEMRAFIESPNHHVYHARLTDRFGEYGVIALAVVEKAGDEWRLPVLLMSCRAFGRGVEDALIAGIMEEAKQSGATRLALSFVPSEKNAPAKAFVEANFPDGVRVLTDSLLSPSWISTTNENF